uniref:SKP1 component POZ domain-containing protein n=1 Tax=Ailuropoda melanoleuca TaxID=9646 RepID=A0A7N5JUV3_AILME
MDNITGGEEKTYCGCEGPDAMSVKSIPLDGHEFIIKRRHALTSGTIKAMLTGPDRGMADGRQLPRLLNKINYNKLLSSFST